MTKSSRLNARLDGELSKKIERLRRRAGSTVTDVLRRSIELYYDAEFGGEPEGAQGLFATGFVGCTEGPADLSTRYKERLTETLEKKT